MKKSLIALAMVAPVLAGTGKPVYLAPAPTPAPLQAAAAPCPLSWEVAAVYNFANTDLLKHSVGEDKDIDTYGADLTAVYALNENNSVNLRFGYTFGDEVNKEAAAWGERQETDVHTFYLMPGYRYTTALTDTVSAFIGANVGVTNMSIKNHWRGEDYTLTEHDSAWGFAYSAEVGLRFALCKNSDLFVAYSFNGSSAKPKATKEGWIDFKAKRQTYNGIRAGVTVKF